MKHHPDFEDYSDADEDLGPSKSQLKRESDELQAIGIRLIDMQPAQLDQLPIPDALLEAVELAKRIRNKREGYRRQLQLIGKLMRHLDTAELEQALASLAHQHDEQNARFHQLEKQRDAILAQGDTAIQVFLDKYPDADRQKLRQLYRQAQKEQQQQKPPAAARQLFKYLRSVAEG